MLNDKDGFHLIPTAFFDGKGLVLERLHCARGGDINCDVGSALDFLEKSGQQMLRQ